MKKEKNGSIFNISSISGKVFLLLMAMAFILAAAHAASIDIGIKALISLLIITLPIFLVEPILTSGGSFASVLKISALIIITGFIFFSIWPYEDDSILYLAVPVFYMFGAYLDVFFRLIRMPKISDAGFETSSMRGSIRACLRVGYFRKMIILEFWMLLLGGFFSMLTMTYVYEPMGAVYVFFFFVSCAIIFFFINIISIRAVGGNARMAISSVIRFAFIIPVAIFSCIIYFSILLKISMELAGIGG